VVSTWRIDGLIRRQRVCSSCKEPFITSQFEEELDGKDYRSSVSKDAKPSIS